MKFIYGRYELKQYKMYNIRRFAIFDKKESGGRGVGLRGAQGVG